MPSNVLPKAPLPQSSPLGTVMPDGRVLIDQNWWLLMVNICNNVFAVSGSSAPAPPPAVSDSGQYSDILPDPKPQASPIITVTVPGSPFSYTAPFDGTLLISGGAGVSVILGRPANDFASVGAITNPLIPLSRADQAVVTYTTAPTVYFIPS